ncbi:MAG: hypothetical protein O2788_04070 [Chloroflexi bacterium]|nr:hypothetical protein [Chloroflexota bacterium]
MISAKAFELPARQNILSTVMVLCLLLAACSQPVDPKIEDFPTYLIGTWSPVDGPVGTMKFEGTGSSGIAIRSADGINAESFTFQWVAPAQIRTNLSNETEFTVLFEDGGDTLVLATVSAAEANAIIRYKRLK